MITLQKGRHVFQLGNVVFGVAAVLLQQGKNTVELGACIGLEQLLQVPVDRLPGGDLYFGVFNAGNLLSTAR